MRSDVEYVRPSSLQEAVAFLSDHGPKTKPLAGGTDLLIEVRAGACKARYIMDIGRIPELRGIAVTGEGLSIGAGVTISEIARSEEVKRFAPVLLKSCLTFGSPQVRNTATIGGNIANASPSADAFPPLVVHEAMAILAGPNGERRIPVEQSAAGPNRSNIGHDELIVRFILKPSEGGFCEFLKIGRRKALAIARVSMAVLLEKDTVGAIRFVRFCLGSCTPVPCRIKEVEEFLTGKIPAEAVVAEAGRLAAQKMIEISGRRPTTVYKEQAVKGLFMRLLYPMVKNE